MNSILKKATEGDWLLIMLIAISTLFALVISRYRNLLWKVLMAAFFKQYYIGLQREENETYKKVSLQLNFIALLSLAMFFYLWLAKGAFLSESWWLKTTRYHFHGFSLYLLFIGLVSLAIFSQILALRIFGWLFNTKEANKEYEFNIWLIYKLLGVFILPVLFFIAFANQGIASFLLYFSIILFAIVLLRRYFIAFRIGWNVNSFPKIYSFLYICTIEILPLAIMVKIFRTEIQTILSF